MSTPVIIDGAQGEGGGQILRSALTLSAISGRPFVIERIRAGRNKPGLLRQHLAAVSAAAHICGAEVEGASPGAQTLRFTPGPLRGGEHRLAIGSAGSCTLVLQTVLPALCRADTPSRFIVVGGTHNPAAPPADFLTRSWQPLLARMGLNCSIALQRHGFYPAGGGVLQLEVLPARAQPLHLLERGALRQLRASAVIAGIPGSVAQRELNTLASELGDPGLEVEVRALPQHEGPGNILLLEAEYEQLSVVFSTCGRRGLPAEQVAREVVQQLRQYQRSPAPVDAHLADQLLLPLVLAGQGSFLSTHATPHLRSNIEVIRAFSDIDIRLEAQDDQGWLVRVG